MIDDETSSLHQRIGQALIGEAPAGWVALNTVCRRAGNLEESETTATMDDGTIVSVWNASVDFSLAFDELREAMHREGTGAWYTAVVTVTRDGRITFDFDYDSEPAWDISADPQTYVEDLEMFPRDLAHQPTWLREKIREADA